MSVSIRLRMSIIGHDTLLVLTTFGACPKCQSIDGFFQRGKRVIGFCNQHRLKWRSPATLVHAMGGSPARTSGVPSMVPERGR